MIAALVYTLACASSHALVIGNNQPFRDAGEELDVLRYADDDALAFADWAQSSGASVTLLSLLDRSSQARAPEWAARALPPTLTELRRAIALLERKISQEQAAGEPSLVWLYFSGHGALSAEREPELVLFDAGLTQKELYSLLDALMGATVHLVVDACHAEAVVRPREVSQGTAKGHSAPADPAAMELFKAKASLARYPRTGAIIATAVQQSAHEWDVYGGGVFTHQLLSGLRGAADVNQDGRVEYSELHAFIVAANREITDVRARIDVLMKAPPIDQRTALVDFARVRGGFAQISGESAPRFWIETARGERLVDAHIERTHRITLMLPMATELYLRTPSGEAAFRLDDERPSALDTLRLRPLSIKARGAVSSALTRGLFAAAYGPLYYRGFVDSSGELSVSFGANAKTEEGTPPRKAAALALWSVAGASTIAAVVTGALAIDAANTYRTTETRALGEAAARRYDASGAAFIASAALALTSAAIAFAVYPWSKAALPLVSFAGDRFQLGFAAEF